MISAVVGILFIALFVCVLIGARIRDRSWRRAIIADLVAKGRTITTADALERVFAYEALLIEDNSLIENAMWILPEGVSSGRTDFDLYDAVKESGILLVDYQPGLHRAQFEQPIVATRLRRLRTTVLIDP